MLRNEASNLLKKEQFTNYNLFEYREDKPFEIVVKQTGNRFVVYETNSFGSYDNKGMCICLTEEEAIEEFVERLFQREGKEVPDSLY
jgi:hypothetical protein